MIQAHLAKKLFTGEHWIFDSAAMVEEGLVTTIVSKEAVPVGTRIIDYGDNFLVPCFLDLQIYGADGALLAVEPNAETLKKIFDYSKAGGAHYFQPTVATNPTDIVYKCIDAVRDYWLNGGEGVIGLHIEGPWINKAKKGAHIEAFIHSPTVEEVTALLEYGKGVITMITIAPEVCSVEVIELITSYGVIVSAGHSNATFDQATGAFNRGIATATHLYNAMSPLNHREPGIVGAIMQHTGVRSSIVPDGYHVDFAAISIAKKVMQERLFFITDAVTETDKGHYPHKLDGEKYVSNGILSGSALTMSKCVKNCVEKTGIELSEALRMASLYPATVIKMDNKLGKIAIGYRADFAVLNDNLEVVEMRQ
jgi:N-acetylglucosamine-6-phosphate deacetylase